MGEDNGNYAVPQSALDPTVAVNNTQTTPTQLKNVNSGYAYSVRVAACALQCLAAPKLKCQQGNRGHTLVSPC